MCDILGSTHTSSLKIRTFMEIFSNVTRIQVFSGVIVEHIKFTLIAK